LILEQGQDRRERPSDVGHAAWDSMVRYQQGLKARGVLLASEALKTEGVRIMAQDGKRRIVDGPFAESKEIVGGFFLLDCATKEEAMAIADECPAAAWATVEVRETGRCYE